MGMAVEWAGRLEGWEGVAFGAGLYLLVCCALFACGLLTSIEDPEDVAVREGGKDFAPAPAPAWEPEDEAPEHSWPPPEPARQRELRHAFGARRVMPSWIHASAKEFQDARREAATRA